MATFFGEVVLPSSRAFFDDCDDSDIEEDDCPPRIELLFTKKPGVEPKNSNVFFIVDGTVAVAFSKVGLISNADKVIGEIELSLPETKDEFGIAPYKPESTKLYALANNNVLLQISSIIDVMNANDLTLLLGDWLKRCKKLVIIASRPSAVYRCESTNDMPVCFVRALATSAIQHPENIKHLDQPNYMSDFPASVMCWCESVKLPAILMAVYSDQPRLDKTCLGRIVASLYDLGLASSVLSCDAPTDELVNMDRTFMYI